MTIYIPSSDGSRNYAVNPITETCNCAAGRHRKRCRHLALALDKFRSMCEQTDAGDAGTDLPGGDPDYGDPDHGFSDDEILAAKRGRGVYSDFLGY